MKIRTFENYTPENPWVEVDATDRLEFELKYDEEWFTKKEFIQILKTIIDNFNWKYVDGDDVLNDGGINPTVQRSYITINLQFMGQKIRIEKYEDEWFFLFFYIGSVEKSESVKIYKCDQFDALLDCLKNNLHLFDEEIEKLSSQRSKRGFDRNWVKK